LLVISNRLKELFLGGRTWPTPLRLQIC